jgi:putative phosphoesterase
MKIGLLSDTHSYLDPKVFEYFKEVDEIWHAGDFGNTVLSDQLSSFKKLRGVYGNIDGDQLRLIHPEINIFNVAGAKVMMIHIGGYPGRYSKGVLDIIKRERPKIFISGHSHILKAIPDKRNRLLHLNPGAAGKAGWHKVRTLMRFEINNGIPQNLEVIELMDSKV